MRKRMLSLTTSKKGFTLIELLIVIAIILILIAIALPNFLEAQIRARVTKAKGDLRTLATAFETYYQDWQQYPPQHDPNDNSQKGLWQITSPLKYLAAIPQDPFAEAGSSTIDPVAGEIGWEVASTAATPRQALLSRIKQYGMAQIQAYHIASHGPNQNDDFNNNDRWVWCIAPPGNPCDPSSTSGGDGFMTYAPTNGTKSSGEIYQLGGEWRNGGYCIDGWNHIAGQYYGKK